MDELDEVIARYGGVNFCALAPHKQAEYMGAVAQRGAMHALKAVGLNDSEAAADIRDIRDLLRGLRVVRRAAWKTTLTALGRMLGWTMFVALAALFLKGREARDIATLIGQ